LGDTSAGAASNSLRLLHWTFGHLHSNSRSGVSVWAYAHAGMATASIASMSGWLPNSR
jgi:hypothetical protein